MALHRDIYWIGKQWAVTGFGVQAVDQRLQGAFDVEVARLWDDDLAARMRGHAWVDGADFDKALMTARKRFPEPAKTSVPLESAPELIQRPAAIPSGQHGQPPLADLRPAEEATAEIPEPTATPLPPFQLRIQGQLARFLPQWRVRRKGQFPLENPGI